MSTESETEAEKTFALFWEIQLRKLDKGHARIAWKKALKKMPAAEIIAAYRRFAVWVDANKKEEKFVPYPATWLNGERWDDQLPGMTAAASLSDADIWRTRLKAYKRGVWSEKWGSRPGNGCSAPPAILQEFGLSP